MAVDDVTVAILAAFKLACERLSTASGSDGKPLEQNFSVKDVWYRFELGWDEYGDTPLLISELYTIIMKLHEVSVKYHMRQVTFKYLLADRFHAVGRLRNAPKPAPHRQAALGPQSQDVPDGHITWSEYGRSMNFRVVANAMMGLLDNSWDVMVKSRQPSGEIRLDQNPFTYQDSVGLVELEVSAPPGKLSLEDVIDVAFYSALFGRLFRMKEHRCVLTNTYYPTETRVIGTISRVEN
ncbi:MAG: hypothetical protein Q9211_000584 [Gyalolechia sp. 1 TL-2023]